MANIPPSEFIEADYLKFSKQNGEYFVKTLQANTLVPDKYDYIAMGYPNSTTETFTYKIGGAIVPAMVAGGISSYQGEAIVVSQTGTMLSAMTLIGSVTGTFTTEGSASVTVQMNGNGTFTISQSGSINMTTALSGAGTWSITGDGLLALIVPFEGAGSLTFTAAANLKGLASMAGDITPFTELSPENLAAAVWNAVLSEYQDVGSTGKALNDAGAAGNPWSADASTNNDPGTMGEKLNDAAASGGSSGLTLGQFLALK